MSFRDEVYDWVETYLALTNGEEDFVNNPSEPANYSVDEFVDGCLEYFEDLKRRGVRLEKDRNIAKELLEEELPEKYAGAVRNVSIPAEGRRTLMYSKLEKADF